MNYWLAKRASKLNQSSTYSHDSSVDIWNLHFMNDEGNCDYEKMARYFVKHFHPKCENFDAIIFECTEICRAKCPAIFPASKRENFCKLMMISRIKAIKRLDEKRAGC
jgi:hypothetical protein